MRHICKIVCQYLLINLFVWIFSLFKFDILHLHLQCPVHLSCMSLECGRKPENPVETHANTRGEHANSTQTGRGPRFKARTFCCEATVPATEPPCCPWRSMKDFVENHATKPFTDLHLSPCSSSSSQVQQEHKFFFIQEKKRRKQFFFFLFVFCFFSVLPVSSENQRTLNTSTVLWMNNNSDTSGGDCFLPDVVESSDVQAILTFSGNSDALLCPSCKLNTHTHTVSVLFM